MIRTLRLFFVDTTGDKRTVSLNYAKASPLAADVQALGEAMQDEYFFADSLMFTGADLTERTTTVIV